MIRVATLSRSRSICITSPAAYATQGTAFARLDVDDIRRYLLLGRIPLPGSRPHHSQSALASYYFSVSGRLPWSFEGILHKALDPEIARSLQDAITTNVRVWV